MAVITLNGSPMHTIGSLPEIGSQAPDFILTKSDLSEVELKNYRGKVLVINIFPSLDTPTCATAMRRFNDIASQNSQAVVFCVSEDLPFAQKRFCSSQGLSNVITVSAFRHPEFGNDYGVMIIDGPLTGILSRAVIVIDEQGKVVYTEQVKELSNEPDYKLILSKLQNKASA
ncbi:putative thiol peroxidase [Aquicella siphonis]|uniref:Thiol peroxidase n=1 Tax=Aquicella siphonis TaxID=254247 RepID=A0A5E4PK35_9COXI|nr:thiol peroxidase [Aquicella siphonis]VVC77294.1 putative thiol peroxidase [Aquicella siphonis]